ncbi:MAG: TetR/AcrR family transcriptional regulator, partial [Flammeovirgaceae bacterium]
LLNYYYRSKEKLFNEIMSETLFTFLSSIVSIYNDTNTSLEEKLQNLTSSYIDQIIEQPEIPVFVLSELRANPDKFMSIMAKTENLQDSVLFQQIQAHLDEKGIKENPIHMLLNTMGMILFPFIATPLLKRITHVDDEQFKMLMHERKKMITNWIMKIMT